jgi:KUP system potassium uptake protein
MADGILTPAVSVTSAASGIAVAKPSTINDVTGIALVGISHPNSAPTSLNRILYQAFLIPFFLAQPFGTGRLGVAFAPSE